MSNVAYDTKLITIHVDKLTGGVPKHPAIVEGWLKHKAGLSEGLRDAVERVMAESGVEAAEERVDQEALKGWNGFMQDACGLYIEARQVKAMLKENANILKEVLKRTALKSKVSERVFVHGSKHRDRIYLQRDGVVLQQPDEVDERPIDVMTAQGPRSSLKRSDIVHDVTLEFLVSALQEPKTSKHRVTMDDVAAFLAHAQHNGVGADRSQGSGQFSVVSVEDAVTPARPTDNDVLAMFR